MGDSDLSGDESEMRALRQARGGIGPAKRPASWQENGASKHGRTDDAEIIEDMPFKPPTRRKPAEDAEIIEDVSFKPVCQTLSSQILICKPPPMRKKADEDGDEMDMAAIMGFAVFGKTKAAKAPAANAKQTPLVSEPIRVEKAIVVPQSASEYREGMRASRIARANQVVDDEPVAVEDGDAAANEGASSDDDDMDGSESDGAADERDDAGLGRERMFPITSEVTLEHGSKSVTTISLDASGARMATGSVDYEVKMWDFNGMDKSLRSFRTLEPFEAHAISAVKYSVTGDKILVTSGKVQAKILDRDGKELCETVRGDMYISDMNNTKGHVASINGGAWHPTTKNIYMTWGNDSTLRLWDVDAHWKNEHVIKSRNQQGKKASVTAGAFSPDGKWIACGTESGGLLVWRSTGTFIRPLHSQYAAHGGAVTSVCFSRDSKSIATRGMDDSLKLWNGISLAKPVHVATGLECAWEHTECLFSPDDTLVVTGTSVRPDSGQMGKLLFFDRATFQKMQEVDITAASVVALEWHPKLNQIFVGCSNGQVKIFFSERASLRGAKLCANRLVKRRAQYDGFAAVDSSAPNIITPHALPLFQHVEKRRPTQRQKDKARKDPIKTKIPERPFDEKYGKGGKTAPNWTPWIKDMVEKDTTRDDDPREAILRFAKEAEENPRYIQSAWNAEARKPILAEKVESSDEEDK